ncbi:hypothetical protein [Methylibium petroleiphilum]|uniref:Uncharacterized protein n=1 Tax=Methylibium petroleiphilum (strain ATCC BAA-1232 / LMG 22953 / PM1) TaxID=420662 RepID=A2SNA1_METPP|nr:hypothetical protein [Methylibium petroleiphilum]ABM97040.1 conserved hypothetical protein [Methylibium petroleiphilum PM1]
MSTAVATAPRCGQMALVYGGLRLNLQVLESAAGFYIGTTHEDMPYSRESAEYWRKREAAEQALADGTWTQRDQP